MLHPSTICETGGGNDVAPYGFYAPPIVRDARRDECPFKDSVYDSPMSVSRRQGLSYEQRVKVRLEALFGPRFEAGVWFSYDVGIKGRPRRFCQVDGLIASVPCPIVFEIKIRWMDTAWWQLVKLYSPIVECALESTHKPSLVAIVRSFDPAVVVPKPPRLLDGAEQIPELDPGEMGVVVWK